MAKISPKPNLLSYQRRNQFFRYSPLLIMLALAVVAAWIGHYIAALLATALTLLGLYDIAQHKHAILRNYPLSGHLRFLFEDFRPEIRQYFIEDDNEKVPFSRQQRSLVYQRSKNQSDTCAFGSLTDLYTDGREWFLQSTAPKVIKSHDFRILVGNHLCTKPYSASVLNISAMSFGSLSANATLALNKGAKMGGFFHDAGEGAISPYHQKHGGDLVFEIGTGYFGCRNKDGGFSPEQFAQKACLDQIKMIEIKLSQGAKPGKGGMLPAKKITPEIAAARDIPESEDCISPPFHSAFSTPRQMVAFWQKLRKLSGGKPVGFKLCLGQPWEFMAIVKAMIEEDDYPDFIVVDGAEGGTGAAPIEYMDHIGMPLDDAFMFVHNTLIGAGVREHIKIGVSGKIISAFDMARMLALGADWCNSARGFMFALGCIQSRQCHTNTCPTGVATQDPHRQNALVVDIKAERVLNFHTNTLKALSGIVGAVGCHHPDELQPHHIARRESDGQIKLLSKHFYMMDKNALQVGSARAEIFNQMWRMASPDSFSPISVNDIARNKDARQYVTI